ncbi:type III-B CRISPR module RAMP protein Cmr1 [Ectothiorhodospira haloalkaliphila]|uniref:type III-B CRISPR module RAMP protein Cmr1 n=1 Tax=Ectothiorhodospira haloalkaliphila TaxID=421628 RepID=UPI001EE88A9C|nr:type III-B CRISPR module RAMP protein Cmr1 [Ectothiorhodospira haloalkaliphila]MCG5525873.1 type III-B CRISPR module RAMP protein Cmr1 [Ectothiorhodospira haloalkaliphila]
MGTEIRATYKIVTPMFLGDGDSSQLANTIRPPAVKGALRFWWRALAWARHAHHDQGQTLKAIHREEAALFGAAADTETGGGQGAFILRVTDTEGMPKASRISASGGQGYLLGQGLYHFRDGVNRDSFSHGTFTVVLRIRPGASDEQQRQLLDALLLFGLLGGLGSRVRRGWGSVSITKLEADLENFHAPSSRDDYIKQLRGLIAETRECKPLPSYTALSSHSRIDISKRDSSAMDLLTYAGEEMQLYRSYGRNGKVNGKAAEKNFKDDHDLIFNALSGNKSNNVLPQRIVFGLPHNYFFSSTKKKMDIAPDLNGGSRRASPLLMHVHEVDPRQYLLVQTLIPATFLPQGAQVKRGNRLVPAGDPKWQVLHEYLDRFPGREGLFS